MYIGGALFLLAVGAIFAFAVQDAINGVDLVMIGYILMAVGVLGLVLSFVLNAQRGRGSDPRVDPPR